MNRSSNKDQTPLVTIHSLIFNNGRYFEQSLLSVINQSCPSQAIEHIIVDDCSEDNSFEIIKSLLLKYNYHCTLIQNDRNLGIVRTLNKTLRILQRKILDRDK